jgi:hypothetical protein
MKQSAYDVISIALAKEQFSLMEGVRKNNIRRPDYFENKAFSLVVYTQERSPRADLIMAGPRSGFNRSDRSLEGE